MAFWASKGNDDLSSNKFLGKLSLRPDYFLFVKSHSCRVCSISAPRKHKFSTSSTVQIVYHHVPSKSRTETRLDPLVSVSLWQCECLSQSGFRVCSLSPLVLFLTDWMSFLGSPQAASGAFAQHTQHRESPALLCAGTTDSFCIWVEGI